MPVQGSAQVREQAAPVEPVVAGERLVRERFDFPQGVAEQRGVSLVDGRGIRAELAVKLRQPAGARELGKEPVSFLEAAIRKGAELPHRRVQPATRRHWRPAC